MKLSNLISPEMMEANAALHRLPKGFGGSGWKHHEVVKQFIALLNAQDMLDYGCGEGTLKKTLIKDGVKIPITEYDPAVKGKSALPKPHDLVVCTDVLEHVEPDKLETVLRHIRTLTRQGAYLTIATRAANKLLLDGRNAHLIIEDTPWWKKKVEAIDWHLMAIDDRRKGNGEGHEVRMWLTP